MKKKSTSDTPKTPQKPNNATEIPKPKPRHPDADYVQKTHFGYVGAYA